MARSVVDVGVIGARAVVFEADAVANLLPALFGTGFPGFFQWFDGSWGSAILVGKMAKDSILKPNPFRLPPEFCFRIIPSAVQRAKQQAGVLCGINSRES